jgi:hypothetical protein
VFPSLAKLLEEIIMMLLSYGMCISFTAPKAIALNQQYKGDR